MLEALMVFWHPFSTEEKHEVTTQFMLPVPIKFPQPPTMQLSPPEEI